MNTTPLEDQVHDALHRRADPIHHAPLTITDVRRRAGRIRRRRRIAAGAAVAATLAVAVPVGLAMNGPAPRTDVPPATQTPQTPQVIGTVRIDPRSAEVGAGPGVPLIDTTGPTLLAGDQELDLPRAYERITPYRAGWLATRLVDDGGGRSVEVLTDTFAVVDGPVEASSFTVSADGSRVAWAEFGGASWSIINNDAAGEEQERPWMTVPEGPDGSEVGTIGFVSDDEVLAFQFDERTGTIATFLAEGDEVVQLPWIEEAASASPVTGMIAGRTTYDAGRSCDAVFDGRTRAPEPVWTDCERALGDFNADGSLLVGFAPTPGGPPPGLSILDATTGRSLVDFEVTGGRDRVVGIATQVVWEDDETLLATYVDGNQQYVVRLGLDGTVERVAGPVRNDDFTLSLRLTPGAVG